MNIIVTTSMEDENGNSRCRIAIDGKPVISVGPLWECPEDATLERDLNFVYQIPDLLKRAYEAGKSGEPFLVDYVQELN